MIREGKTRDKIERNNPSEKREETKTNRVI